jgi:hypothetical protein
VPLRVDALRESYHGCPAIPPHFIPAPLGALERSLRPCGAWGAQGHMQFPAHGTGGQQPRDAGGGGGRVRGGRQRRRAQLQAAAAAATRGRIQPVRRRTTRVHGAADGAHGSHGDGHGAGGANRTSFRLRCAPPSLRRSSDTRWRVLVRLFIPYGARRRAYQPAAAFSIAQLCSSEPSRHPRASGPPPQRHPPLHSQR